MAETNDSRHPAAPYIGWIVLMSLLTGAMAGILGYRITEASAGKARIVAASVSAPVAAHKPALRRIDAQLLGGEPQVSLLLDQPLQYDAHRLDGPDRVYVDVHGASVAPELSGKTLFMNSGGLSTIRVGQTQDAVRVVLDLDKRFDYSVTQQTDPPTLVVRLSPAAAAKAKHKSANPKAKAPAQVKSRSAVGVLRPLEARGGWTQAGSLPAR